MQSCSKCTIVTSERERGVVVFLPTRAVHAKVSTATTLCHPMQYIYNNRSAQHKKTAFKGDLDRSMSLGITTLFCVSLDTPSTPEGEGPTLHNVVHSALTALTGVKLDISEATPPLATAAVGDGATYRHTDLTRAHFPSPAPSTGRNSCLGRTEEQHRPSTSRQQYNQYRGQRHPLMNSIIAHPRCWPFLASRGGPF